jgi:hypothetical protein
LTAAGITGNVLAMPVIEGHTINQRRGAHRGG